MIPEPNEDRVSHLQLDRLHTGELTGDERARVEAYVAATPAAQAYLAELEAARSQVAPLDAAALRRRATQVAPAPVVPAPANGWRWFVPVLLAALVAAFALPMLVRSPDDAYTTDVRVKGGATLVPFVDEAGAMVPYDGRTVGEGDVMQFMVRRGDYRQVVVLSVDGQGTVTVFWPEAPSTVAHLSDRAEVPLPGSITLDDAPGPEVFVAVFTGDVKSAVAEAKATWQSGGEPALVEWGSSRPDVDTVVVERR